MRSEVRIKLVPANVELGKTSKVEYHTPHGVFSKDQAGEVAVPDYMAKVGVKGVFLGGCIATGIGLLEPGCPGSRAARAHAHAFKGGSPF